LSGGSQDERGGMSVLLLGQEEGLFVPLSESLRRDGFRVELVGNLYRAVAQFARQPADVAAVDLDPLDQSELSAIRILRELSPDALIVGVFSQLHRPRAALALKLGADVCLLQPFYPGEFSAVLRRWAARLEQRRSARKAHEEHLAALSRLAKGIAHEINNPLTTLCGWLELMEAEQERPEAERERLASMRAEAERIARVVERLLAFGELPPKHRAPVDIDALLAELVEQTRSRAEGVRVEAELRSGGALVWGDEGQLRKACALLLDDALAALNGQGSVSVRTRMLEGNQVELTVHDTGRQIQAADLSKLFEPYAVMPRIGETMSLAYPAIYGIFRSHGGELSVSSDRERGTEFQVRLPALSTTP